MMSSDFLNKLSDEGNALLEVRLKHKVQRKVLYATKCGS